MRALLPLLLLPHLALGQTSVVTTPGGPPRGVALPPTSAALVDEAFAPVVNPAGLSFVGAPQLFYVHEAHPAQALSGNGLYLGTPLFGGLGAGVSLEWLGGGGAPRYRRTAWALSLGSPTFGLGGTLNHYAARGQPFDGLSSVDFGLGGRPFSFLSWGALVRNVDAPTRGGVTLPRTFQLAAGLRPFRSDTTLAVDWQLRPESLETGRLTYTLKGSVLRGLVLGAGFSHGLGSGTPDFAGQVSLTVDSGVLGVTYAPGLAPGPGFTPQAVDHVVAARLSSQPYPSLSPGGGAVALVDLNDRLSAGRGSLLALAGLTDVSDPYLRLMRFLEAAERDERLSGVVLKVEGLPDVGMGKALELRQAVRRLRTAGKKVVAVLLRADDAGYLIASAADQVFAVPEAMLLINGLSASATLFGGTSQWVGVQWDVARQGAYKTAPEQLTNTEVSPAQRETLDALLDDQSRALEQALAEARGLSVERVREAMAQGLLPAERAKQLGLIDAVVTSEQLEESLRTFIPGGVFRPEYSPFAVRRTTWGTPRRIAVVPVIGNISGGRSRTDPLGQQQIAGAETVVAALQRAAHDASVDAIVVRVDSPGGDGLASDLIYRAVLEARRRKPVVASMGDVAASGGYYAAMGANRILALPTTVTGSIGVFLVKPALKGVGEKLRVRRETFSRAPLATLLDTWEPWDEQARQAAQAWIDAFYDDFITEVSRSRRLEKSKVDAAARGRVWSGVAALERGLVDGHGDFLAAVATARELSGIRADEEVQLLLLGEPSGLFSPGTGEPGVWERLLPAPTPSLPVLPAPLQEVAADLQDAALLSEPGVKALLPFRLRIH